MSNTEKMVARWISNPKGLRTTLTGCNVFSEGDTIYSYGRHFPMGILVRNDDGTIRHAVLNGDTYSVSTTRHQSEVRHALARAEITYVIVPFEALSNANIKATTIEPIDVKADGFEYTAQSSSVAPGGMIVDNVRGGYYGSEYVWTNEDTRHFVGSTHGGQLVKLDADGTYRWHSVRHWLGDAVFKAKTQPWGEFERTAYYVSSFDRQESRPLYFLSELPREVFSFEDAMQALKPEAVLTAEDMGREVTRQGDMFAIPTEITTAQIKRMGGVITKRKGPVRDWVENDYNFKMLDDTDFVPAVEAVDFTGDWSHWLSQQGKNYGRHWLWQIMPTTRITKPKHRREIEQATGTPLYGTAHTATEVATLPDGTMLARGSMYHHPWIAGDMWREPDHARRKMGNGKAWHLIARNTVPTRESIAARVAA
ncbi:hypothetical protein SEA_BRUTONGASTER_161 [Gordonia phage BrutonGaster]|uniref:Uncharacterized protein n=1 Tax=Gordonia phage BrutonGaster TaxID=2530116 RepID=A0A482JHG2_9CAUD|nr:hypothetical protein HOV26_gp021 [Gordonia phage BrutonGaster]QBP33375.1 hypothetical protein SEA_BRUTONGASTER_161 [Gordonia phage BrutonGaster]